MGAGNHTLNRLTMSSEKSESFFAECGLAAARLSAQVCSMTFPGGHGMGMLPLGDRHAHTAN